MVVVVSVGAAEAVNRDLETRLLTAVAGKQISVFELILRVNPRL